CGLLDVDEALVRADLEVLARVLVDEGAPDDTVDVPLGRQRHRADYLGTGTSRRLDDRSGASVELRVLVALEPDADVLLCHSGVLSFGSCVSAAFVATGCD